MASCNSIRVRRGESNAQGFCVLSLCLVGFLFLVVVYQASLSILVVFRCCYICCYRLFHGRALYCVATWSCLDIATSTPDFRGILFGSSWWREKSSLLFLLLFCDVLTCLTHSPRWVDCFSSIVYRSIVSDLGAERKKDVYSHLLFCMHVVDSVTLSQPALLL